MKKMILLTAALITISLGSCKKEKNDEHITINVNTNVSDKKLDNKSGGVYFISTLVGEYIFRVNLKNGDNNMVCDMLHNEVYTKLPGQKTEWIPGEELNDYEFSAYGVKLIIDIDELGTAQAKVVVSEKEYETVVFKSTKEEPVKVYYGTRINIEEWKNEIYEEIGFEVFIIQNEYYYFGRTINSHTNFGWETKEYFIYDKFDKILDNEIFFRVSDNIGWGKENYEIWNYFFDENKIYFVMNYSETDILDINLPLRFQD